MPPRRVAQRPSPPRCAAARGNVAAACPARSRRSCCRPSCCSLWAAPCRRRIWQLHRWCAACGAARCVGVSAGRGCGRGWGLCTRAAAGMGAVRRCRVTARPAASPQTQIHAKAVACCAYWSSQCLTNAHSGLRPPPRRPAGVTSLATHLLPDAISNAEKAIALASAMPHLASLHAHFGARCHGTALSTFFRSIADMARLRELRLTSWVPYAPQKGAVPLGCFASLNLGGVTSLTIDGAALSNNDMLVRVVRGKGFALAPQMCRLPCILSICAALPSLGSQTRRSAAPLHALTRQPSCAPRARAPPRLALRAPSTAPRARTI
jgi:hypothetical protein